MAVDDETLFRQQYSESPDLYEPRLKGASERIRPYIFQILNETKKQGLDFRLRDTSRTSKEQAEKVRTGKSRTLKSRHLTGDAFDLVRFKDGKPSFDEEDYLPLRDIIEELDIPVQQGVITKKKGVSTWWDRGHIQIPSEKGLYGGIKNFEDIVFPKTKDDKKQLSFNIGGK